MLAARSLHGIARSGARPFSSTQARCVSDEFLRKLREKQDEFQKETVDTHMKGSGKYHFYFTCALGAFIGANVCIAMYRIYNKK